MVNLINLECRIKWTNNLLIKKKKKKKDSKHKTRNYTTPRGEHRQNTLWHKSQQDPLWPTSQNIGNKSRNSSTLATSCEELTHWKRPWCWEGLGAGGEGDDRGWDGWMASLTRWTWVWVNSGSWWWTGRPGVLRFMGSKRVKHNWATELNWTNKSPGMDGLHNRILPNI